MRKILLTLAIPFMSLTSAYAADAGSADTPKTRSEVKAGAAAPPAVTSAAEAADSKAPVSGKSRADVKAEARSAARTGNLTNPTPADAALKADSVAGPASAHAGKTRHQKRPDAVTGAGVVTGSSPGSAASPATGTLSSETRKPTN